MTLGEIIQKAVEAVTAGGDPDAYPTLDVEGLAEAHLETVFALVARRHAADGRTALLARKQKTLSFSVGSATLTDDVMQSCLEQSTLRDTADATKLYSYVPHEEDALAAYDRRLGYYWAPSQGTLNVIEPDEADVSLTGSLLLTGLCVWDVPDDLDTDVGVSLEVAADLIAALSEAVRANLAAEMPVVKAA